MALRLIIALVVLLAGAVFATVLVMVSTNGYGTAGMNEDQAAAIYLVTGLAIVTLLAWLTAAVSRRLSARLGWSGWVTLPLMLAPVLLLEQVLLLIAGIVAAELSTPPL